MSELRQISEEIVARLQPCQPTAHPAKKLTDCQLRCAMTRRFPMSWSTALKPRMKQSRCGLWEVRDFDDMFHGETQVEAYRLWLYATTREALGKGSAQ